MFDTIIVPLDGSSTAEVALTYAEEMASRLDSELILLLVKDSQDTLSEHLLICYLQDRIKAIKEASAPFLKESGDKELRVQFKILTGNPANEIINFTEKIPGSQIIMATHGQSGVGTRWPLGSVAEKVVQATTHPVGLIRAEGDKPAVRRPLKLEKILAPLDGSKGSQASLPYIKEMASRLKVEVIFLQVVTRDISSYYAPSNQEITGYKDQIKESLSNLVKDFEKSGIKATFDVVDTDNGIAEKIDAYAKEHDIDLVIMATHGRLGPRRWVLGSVASDLARQGSTPLLLVRTAGPSVNK